MATHSIILPGKPMDRGAWWPTIHRVAKKHDLAATKQQQHNLYLRPWLNGFEENVSKTLYLMPFSLAFIDQTTDSSFSIFLLPLESINSVSTHLSVCMLSHFSCVHLFVTPWAVARQAPLSMGFSRQGYWSVSPCPPPGHLPNPGIKPVSVMSLALARDFLTTSTTREVLQLQ